MSKVNSKNVNQQNDKKPKAGNFHMTKVKKFNAKKYDGRRGGIFIYSEGTYFFGLDRKSNDLTDFGGGKDSKDQSILHTALREFHEETFGVLNGIVTMNEVMNGTVYYSKRCCLVCVDLPMSDKLKTFRESYLKKLDELKPNCNENLMSSNNEFLSRNDSKDSDSDQSSEDENSNEIAIENSDIIALSEEDFLLRLHNTNEGKKRIPHKFYRLIGRILRKFFPNPEEINAKMKPVVQNNSDTNSDTESDEDSDYMERMVAINRKFNKYK